ncbi:MAG: hypothetical protein V4582_22425 [Pseudomonadota bacterium]
MLRPGGPGWALALPAQVKPQAKVMSQPARAASLKLMRVSMSFS